MGDSNEFGRELRKLRRSNKDVISLADIADVVDCSVTYISAIERGERNPPSNEKIKRILAFLGCEEEYSRMIELAVKARRAVEIPVDGSNPQWTNVLLGLARRSEEGMDVNDPLIAQLNALLEKEEKEKQCRTLSQELKRKQNDKSKRKPRNF